MANFTNAKRTYNRFNIPLIIELYLNKITTSCKASVAHAVSEKIDRLVAAKKHLEVRLVALAEETKGLLSRLKLMPEIRRIKREIESLNCKMVDWVNDVYSYFLEK